MPSWILWLSPVVVAPMLAIVWMSWAARPRRPVEAMLTVEQHDRFRQAITASVPTARTPHSSDKRPSDKQSRSLSA